MLVMFITTPDWSRQSVWYMGIIYMAQLILASILYWLQSRSVDISWALNSPILMTTVVILLIVICLSPVQIEGQSQKSLLEIILKRFNWMVEQRLQSVYHGL